VIPKSGRTRFSRSTRTRGSERFASRARRLVLIAVQRQSGRSLRTLAPMLAEDNETILSELGYSLDEVERLKRDRILYSQALRKES
jgi:crotonobetainyl-CoA:carnitine CoA-transferase CaiB-like acyl-CoA transferase